MPADRVDPLGGWFNLGDRDLTQLPTDTRVTQPRSTESAGMVPKAGQIIDLIIPATELIPLSSAYIWTKIGGAGFNQLHNHPGGATLAYYSTALPALAQQIGTKIAQLGLFGFQTLNTDSANLQLSAYLRSFSTAAADNALITVNSTSNGTRHLDTTDANIAIQQGTAYYLLVSFNQQAPYTVADLEENWLTMKIVLPV